jgi:hypothetical protein
MLRTKPVITINVTCTTMKEETEHREEVNGARGLPAAKQLRIPVKVIDCCGRHGNTSEDCRWAENEDDAEIGDLLQRVVTIKSIELSWQVECRIVYPGVPGLQQHQWRLGYEPPPLLAIEEHDDKEESRDNEAVDVEKVPTPSQTNGMSVAGSSNERRNIARIVLRGRDAVPGNYDRRQPNPLATRGAVIVEVETRMIGKNR